MLRKKDSPFAAYSTRADEAVLMVSSSRVGHAGVRVDATNSTVVLAGAVGLVRDTGDAGTSALTPSTR